MQKHLTILFLILSAIPALVEAQPGRVINESMNFPPMPVGTRKELEVQVKGLLGTGEFRVVDSCNSPFTMKTKSQDLTIQNGEVRIRVEFAPTDPKDYREEIILERFPAVQPPNDQIRLRLFGTAFRLVRNEKIEFGNVLTGDSNRRVVLIRKELADDSRWEVLETMPLDEPFQLINRSPVLIGGDTLAFVFSFQPKTTGRFVDSIGLERIHRQTEKPLDTIFVYFLGNGVRMPVEKATLFSNMMVGQVRKDTIAVELGAQVHSQEFSYSIRPKESQSTVTSTLLLQKNPTKENKILVEVTCAPTQFGDGRFGFVLYRSVAGQDALDSTNIVVNLTMVPRPVTLSMGFVADTFYHRIGDTATFDVVVTTNDPIDVPLALESFVCDVTYNPTMFVPLLQSGQQRVVADDRTMLKVGKTGLNGSVLIGSSGLVVGQARGVIVLGDADRTPLTITEASITVGNDGTRRVEPRSSLVLVTNVWRYQDGRPRYVNPMQSTLVADVDPNPVVTQSTLRVANVPVQTGRLDVIDALGQVRVDLTTQLRAGVREFSISSGGAADIALPAGSYYARLVVEGASGNTINSVVRLFVVQ
ncbi:MAG: hypothetical protein IPH85_00220 [Ignavibacteria bacterium]|nr:hypothetical protein [Ignavibacteria bacterium]MBK7184349.1 hypothetical protein [Ignavibacteria bacterium]MBK7413153.1 hypothetical protein [Ignavibacteria bacterium]MBK7576647.1 hypothetical protein [Ignavibacteria bacterium]MBK9181733.1 hypothetical protein [Ignavibacteria bacterium]